jgi:cation transport ATPase
MLKPNKIQTAGAMVRDVSIKRTFGEVPLDREAAILQSLRIEKRGIGEWGDRINGNPELERADVGIAIARTDMAIAANGIHLTSSNFTGIVAIVKLSCATIINIYQNLLLPLFTTSWGFILTTSSLLPFTVWLLNPIIISGAMALSSFLSFPGLGAWYLSTINSQMTPRMQN